MEDLMIIAEANSQVLDYLPIKKDIMALPRSYMISVLHSVLVENFKKWIDERIQIRNN